MEKIRNDIKKFSLLEMAISARKINNDNPEAMTDANRIFLALKLRLSNIDELKDLSKSIVKPVPLTFEIAEEFYDCIYHFLDGDLKGIYDINNIIEVISIYREMIPELKQYFGKEFEDIFT